MTRSSCQSSPPPGSHGSYRYRRALTSSGWVYTNGMIATSTARRKQIEGWRGWGIAGSTCPRCRGQGARGSEQCLRPSRGNPRSLCGQREVPRRINTRRSLPTIHAGRAWTRWRVLYTRKGAFPAVTSDRRTIPPPSCTRAIRRSSRPTTSRVSCLRTLACCCSWYMAGNGQMLRDYLPVWQAHIAHWIAEAVDIPIYIFRYEDVLYRTEVVMRNVMEALPGGWRWSDESIEKAMSMYGPKKSFEEKCGSGIRRASLAEVEMVRRHYSGILGHLGYRFVRVPGT